MGTVEPRKEGGGAPEIPEPEVEGSPCGVELQALIWWSLLVVLSPVR